VAAGRRQQPPYTAAAASDSGAPNASPQLYHFRQNFHPDAPGAPDPLLGWPADEDVLAGANGSSRVTVLGDDARGRPDVLWRPAPPGAVNISNPAANRFRVMPGAPPTAPELPGTDVWHFEALQDEAAGLPRIQRSPKPGGGWTLRPGALAGLLDPRGGRFFYARGAALLSYSWRERAAQAAVAAVYMGV